MSCLGINSSTYRSAKAIHWLYICGSGGDIARAAFVVAQVKPNQFHDRSQIRYLTGHDASGQAIWGEKGIQTQQSCSTMMSLGEFSITYLEPVKRYIILYNSLAPRGIIMRSATDPTGPWSEGVVIFEPRRDGGYGHFMHISSKSSEQTRDALSDHGRDEVWGGEYGPYVMSRFTSGTPDGCRIFYTLSTWNPYQVVIMQSELKLAQ